MLIIVVIVSFTYRIVRASGKSRLVESNTRRSHGTRLGANMKARWLLLGFISYLPIVAQPSPKITLLDGVSLSVHKTWSAVQDTRSTYLIEHRTEAKALDASMVIHTEKRSSHAEALRRLTLIGAQYPKESIFTLIAGWPALERKVVAPFPRPGEHEKRVPFPPPQKSLQVTTAVAVGEYADPLRNTLAAER